jgi:predicted small secreted protein
VSINNRLLVISVFIFSILALYGCETVKGMGKDVKNTWSNLSKSDEWVQKNVW